MKLSSPQGLLVGSRRYFTFGGDWAAVGRAGKRRADGVIDLTTVPATPLIIAQPTKEANPHG